MNKALKVAFLVIILVIPVLVFLFLKGFGKNYYTLPYYHIELVTAAGDTVYSKLSPTQLPSENVQGIRVLSVISLPCELECKERLSQLNRVHDTFDDEARLHLMTLVANASTNEELNDISQFFRVKQEKWALSSLQDPIDTVLVKYRFDQWPLDEKEPEHISKLILLDSDGYYRGYYNGQDLEEVDRLILEIRVLLQKN